MREFISDSTVAYNYLLAQATKQLNDNELVIFPLEVIQVKQQQ